VTFVGIVNLSGAPRTGTLTIAGQTFTVSQVNAAPEPCSYAITSPGSLPAGGADSAFIVATRSDCSWSAINTASWISFTGDYSGSGTRTVGFHVDANPSPSSRSSTIVITGPGDGASFTVSQDGVP
jgi:hypothetical protein